MVPKYIDIVKNAEYIMCIGTEIKYLMMEDKLMIVHQLIGLVTMVVLLVVLLASDPLAPAKLEKKVRK